MLGKFADLSQEAEEEIRDLDGARRRIAELELQVEQFRIASAEPHAAIERAVAAAIVAGAGGLEAEFGAVTQ